MELRGLLKDLDISDTLENGEVVITVLDDEYNSSVWLDRDDTIKIVAHLIDLFNLSVRT